MNINIEISIKDGIVSDMKIKNQEKTVQYCSQEKLEEMLIEDAVHEIREYLLKLE